MSKLVVPRLLKLSCKNIGDTNSKLAYVTYIDENKKIRFQRQWKKEHGNDIRTIDNKPVSGIRLGNGAVNQAIEYGSCRVVDPRGYALDVSVKAMIYVMQYCHIEMGVILSEVVYAWDKQDLMFLPIESPDYEKSLNFTNELYSLNGIKESDLELGASYLSRNNEYSVYMGVYMYFGTGYRYTDNGVTVLSRSIPDSVWRDIWNRPLGILASELYKIVDYVPYEKRYCFVVVHKDKKYGDTFEIVSHKHILNGLYLRKIDDKSGYYEKAKQILNSDKHYRHCKRK